MSINSCNDIFPFLWSTHFIIYIHTLIPTLSYLCKITLESGYCYSVSRKYWQNNFRSSIILFPNRHIRCKLLNINLKISKIY